LTVGFLGRFHHKKNLNRLIQAIGRCPDAVRLRVAGGGEPEYEAELKALADKRGAASRIEWLGFIDAGRRTDFLSGLDLLAAPSKFECFGLVAAEALAAGTPVLLSPTVGVADDIEEAGAGVIAPPRDDALAVALIRLLEDPAALSALQSAARPTAERLYSYDAHGAALKAQYENMLAHNPTSP
jgi:glycosyltransferase involved in cell wall biosynthesis